MSVSVELLAGTAFNLKAVAGHLQTATGRICTREADSSPLRLSQHAKYLLALRGYSQPEGGRGDSFFIRHAHLSFLIQGVSCQVLYDLAVLPAKEQSSMIVSGTLAQWRDALSYPQSVPEMKTVYGEIKRWLTRLGLSEFITNGGVSS